MTGASIGWSIITIGSPLKLTIFSGALECDMERGFFSTFNPYPNYDQP